MNGGQDGNQAILPSRGCIHVSGVYTHTNKGKSGVGCLRHTGGSNGTMLNMFSSVQSLSCAQLFVTPWTAARQASLSITNSGSFLKLMSIESVMPSNHLLLCRPLLLLPSIFPSIRSFPRSQLFASAGQSVGASASASVLPMNIVGYDIDLVGCDIYLPM